MGQRHRIHPLRCFRTAPFISENLAILKSMPGLFQYIQILLHPDVIKFDFYDIAMSLFWIFKNFSLSSVLKNHRAHRVLREKRHNSVLSASSVVDGGKL